MRRFLIAVVSAALLGGLALTTVASAHEDGEDLHFIARATSVEKSDLGDDGKQVVVNFDLFEHDHEKNAGGHTEGSDYSAQDHPAQEPVGHGVAVCVAADPSEGVLCSGNIMVDDGQISSQGIIHVRSHKATGDDGKGHHSVMLPITGGSGEFTGASGEVEISHAGHGHGHGGGHGDTEMHALGMAPAGHGGKKGHGHGHGLHLTFHLEDD